MPQAEQFTRNALLSQRDEDTPFANSPNAWRDRHAGRLKTAGRTCQCNLVRFSVYATAIGWRISLDTKANKW
jgi:hypothetical protein